MKFDLRIKFYDKIDEAKKGFEFFPKEWEGPYRGYNKFVDFARLSFDETQDKEIPFLKDVGIHHDGFVRASEELFLKKKVDYAFFFQKDGRIKYVQFEKWSNKYLQIQTNFFHDKFSIQRVFLGDTFNQPILKNVKRTFYSPFGKEKRKGIKVIQDSPNYFTINFLKDEKKSFWFFLNGNNSPSHQNMIDAIKVCPEIFSDLELFKTYFSSDSFKGTYGENPELDYKTISIKKGISDWKKA